MENEKKVIWETNRGDIIYSENFNVLQDVLIKLIENHNHIEEEQTINYSLLSNRGTEERKSIKIRNIPIIITNIQRKNLEVVNKGKYEYKASISLSYNLEHLEVKDIIPIPTKVNLGGEELFEITITKKNIEKNKIILNIIMNNVYNASLIIFLKHK